ncbi:MAG: signal recognition particle-docking protein FtsY [Holosporales bacterium]|jgi:fused signal recognition particle receptor|nr:signal recognition particle-docking protein FtsY [Holosporales bacterium]
MSFFKKLKSVIYGIIGHDRAAQIGSCDLEDVLIEADFGCALASKIAKEVRGEDDIVPALKAKLEEILLPLVKEIEVDPSKAPYVIVLSGVNGSGKTTTVAKLAFLLKSRGFSVGVVACDTFRAAATEQLSEWASRLGCKIFMGRDRQDPASVAFDAMSSSKCDVLIIDTAGRLHNNADLMNELAKLHRVVAKLDPAAPHMNILILDATTGQNVIEQIKEFSKVRQVSGLIISKMDGSAKGGAIVNVANEFQIPILGVGTGESADKFEPFSVDKFLRGLVE